MSLKSTLEPAREAMRDGAIDSVVLTAWKEKSSSPTKPLTCLENDAVSKSDLSENGLILNHTEEVCRHHQRYTLWKFARLQMQRNPARRCV